MKTVLYTLANILGVCLILYFAWDLPDAKFLGVTLGVYLYGFTFRKGWQF